MLSHFLLSIVVLTLGVVLALEATRPRARDARARAGCGAAALLVGARGVRADRQRARSRRRPARIPGSTVVRRLWSFQPAVYWHVRATAVFGISFALLLVWLVAQRGAAPCAARSSCSACSLVQMAIGEMQYRTHLPWWLVLVHVTLAATRVGGADRVRLSALASGGPRRMA